MFARRFLLRKKGLRERWRNLSFKVWYLFVGNEDGSVWPNNTKDEGRRICWSDPLGLPKFSGVFSNQSCPPDLGVIYFVGPPPPPQVELFIPTENLPITTEAPSLDHCDTQQGPKEEVEAKPNSRIHATLAFF